MIRPLLPYIVSGAGLWALLAPLAASPVFVASGTLSDVSDKSGLTGVLENGVAANSLDGIGSGLAWAGGNTFLAVPDRGPNNPWQANNKVDDTTSFVSRVDTLTLALTQSTPGVFTLAPTLAATTLLYSPTALNYAIANSNNNGIAGAPAINAASKYYFTGRSDNFATGSSLNPDNARLDTEAVRVSADGKSFFVSDEYGPEIYQFDRATGARIRSFALPSAFGITTLSGKKSTENSSNSSGRVTNSGMESLAISPDGTTLIGLMQAPLIQDDGIRNPNARANRIVTIDIATGTTHQYVYDTYLGDTGNVYGVNEMVALNSHEFLVLERDGNSYSGGTSGFVKRIYKIDLNGATDVGALGLSGESNLLPYAVNKSSTPFLDIPAALMAGGIAGANIPAKFEGMALGDDVVVNGITKHTLYLSNDDDFDRTSNGANQFFAFTFTDADLGSTQYVAQTVPEPGPASLGLLGAGVAGLRRRRAAR